MTALGITYAPLIVSGVPTSEQDFKQFWVEVRRKETTSPVYRKFGGGVLGRDHKWRLQGVVFDETILGEVYEFRVGVENINGKLSPFSNWIEKTAGDMTPPPTPSIGTVVKTATAMRIPLASYTKPRDFKEFQWHWDTDNTAPVGDEDIMQATQASVLVIPMESYGSGSTLYIWVRAVDTSGNVSGWATSAEDVGSFVLDGIITVAELLIFQ